MILGWPYSFVAALEPGRAPWTAVPDAIRLGPADDETEVTTRQARQVMTRLIGVGHLCAGDRDMLIVLDLGYNATWLAWLLAGLPAWFHHDGELPVIDGRSGNLAGMRQWTGAIFGTLKDQLARTPLRTSTCTMPSKSAPAGSCSKTRPPRSAPPRYRWQSRGRPPCAEHHPPPPAVPGQLSSAAGNPCHPES